ncbi:MAG TPA: sulfatase-like hydrolase/transferase [Thermoanaerobaculia bacterium]|nr:sulfatase-like hydrolase/transferase [Thermoanaerobaculia bacterium]
MLLLTLDTTRADALGAFGGRGARTPVLDALAARGTRWEQAIASTPLTLPAHSSLFTGLAPPEHGVETNGSTVLPRGLPTLAEAFFARRYATAGFVASLVLDRRFGLARGFQHYDDRIPSEPSPGRHTLDRDARQMTDAALEWLGRRPAGQPVFLWVHYYDPHEWYLPADVKPEAGGAQRYAGQVAAMDREIGRLLAALPGGAGRWLIAAVGDHGESLGEHGETGHGIFLYHATLHVPLVLAGPGVPRGRVIREAVATRRLASTLLSLTAPGRAAAPFGAPLPGLPGLASGPPSPVYLASRYPLTAYGWSPLEGLFDGRFKLIVAPRPELYDLAADPGETRNLLDGPPEQREPARGLKLELAAVRRAFQIHPAEAADPELANALQSLGYLSGTSTGTGGKGTLDPKDGVPLLAELKAAHELVRQKGWQPAVVRLTELVRRSPGNGMFLLSLAQAQLASGDGDAALATFRRVVEDNPRHDDSHCQLADAYARLGRGDDARQEYLLTLALNPRSFGAWWGLADLAERAGNRAEVRALLTRAVEAGTESVSILRRLAEVEARAGDAAAAERYRAAARRLAGR